MISSFKKIIFLIVLVIAIVSNLLAQTKNSSIAFASDTQAPLWMERLWLKAHHNEKATELIFNQIASTKPNTFFILGDVVSLSYKNKTWRKMDKYLTNCRATGTKIFALLGNHEVLGNAKLGIKNFQQRFTEHVKTGYVEIEDSVAVVLLNSNHINLSTEEIITQNNWYANELKRLDTCTKIKFIIVSCHHSPFSNSKIVGSSKWVQDNFVPAFIQSKKCKLFLSGHAHVFEYFKMQGKDFMVIGGGGGLHHPLNKKQNALKTEMPNYNPMFHYLTVELINQHLKIISHQLSKDFSKFENGFQITL